MSNDDATQLARRLARWHLEITRMQYPDDPDLREVFAECGIAKVAAFYKFKDFLHGTFSYYGRFGTNVHPSIATMMWDNRTKSPKRVRWWLRAAEAAGLIRCVGTSGKGTNNYEIVEFWTATADTPIQPDLNMATAMARAFAETDTDKRRQAIREAVRAAGSHAELGEIRRSFQWADLPSDEIEKRTQELNAAHAAVS